VRLATRAWGKGGRPLAVLVHGVTGSSRTWWRVGSYLAGNGRRVVAVDLRGHGASPRMAGGERLEDLTADLYETVAGLLAPDERVDILLGHSLGALVALKLCEVREDLVRRLVLEEPPDSEGGPGGFEGKAQVVQTDAARAREAPGDLVRQRLSGNPSWSEEDAANAVVGLRECDAGSVAALLRHGLRYDLPTLVGGLEIPTLLVLGSEEKGSALPEPERTEVVVALGQGTVETFDAGHCVHRDDFEGYVRLLDDWLVGSGR